MQLLTCEANAPVPNNQPAQQRQRHAIGAQLAQEGHRLARGELQAGAQVLGKIGADARQIRAHANAEARAAHRPAPIPDSISSCGEL